MSTRRWTTQFYKMVPKDPLANVIFRLKILRKCREDKDFRDSIIEICRIDILFFINTFLWTHDPRRKVDGQPSPNIPFITFVEFQDDFVLTIQEVFNEQPVFIEKSRELGITWLTIAVYVWFYLFYETSILLTSHKEELVDKGHNPKRLFAKVDYLLKFLPRWMRPPVEQFQNHRKNLVTEAVISGEATTGDLASGDRRSSVFMDELSKWPNYVVSHALASIQDVSPNIIYVTTPKGGSPVQKLKESNMRQLRLHWSKDPRKNPGLYTSEHGRLKILDKDYQFPDGYPFVLDGKLRSPWYDYRCLIAPFPWIIPQEQDLSWEGASSRPIDPQQLDKISAEHSRKPIVVGELDFDGETMEPTVFKPLDNGRLQLWCDLEEDGRPKRGFYGLGVDIATGTGASLSAIFVIDLLTGTQAAEFATPHLDPAELAQHGMAIGYFFYEAEILWDSGGSGRIFGKRCREQGYPQLYKRKNQKRTTGGDEALYGWSAAQGKEKRLLFEDYYDDLANGRIIVYSEPTLKESGRFVYNGDSIEHEVAIGETDPSGARSNHGDRATAAALANLLRRLRGMGGDAITHKRAQDLPEHSIGHRITKSMAMNPKATQRDRRRLMRMARAGGRSRHAA